MISPIRQEVLRGLAQLSELAPDMRLGQLIVNLSHLAVDPTVESVWDMEDEQLLRAITELVQSLSDRAIPTSTAVR